MNAWLNKHSLCALLLLGMAYVSGGAWAAGCVQTGHDAIAGGSGIGGTGTIAKGTGIGGTGIKLGVFKNEVQVAGSVIASQGAVEAIGNGGPRPLAGGDSVCAGDTITAGPSSLVRIRMADGGLLEIRPQTQIKIEKFAYLGTDKDASLLVLNKGVCRIVTGNLGKQHPGNDLLRTPAATIGVREADHEVAVILPGSGGSSVPGTYDKVNHGTVYLGNGKGEVAVRPDQAGFAADAETEPVLLRTAPDFLGAP